MRALARKSKSATWAAITLLRTAQFELDAGTDVHLRLWMFTARQEFGSRGHLSDKASTTLIAPGQEHQAERRLSSGKR